MRLMLISAVLAALLAGCGGGNDDPAPAAATPEATVAETEPETHELDLDDYSEGVKRYYGGAHTHENGDVEAEYHKPPDPPEAGVGETITLTGTNIGVRMEVTLEDVKRARGRTQVHLGMLNTGITVYEAPLQNAELTFADGSTATAVPDEGCSRGFDPTYLRIDVSHQENVCLLFEGTGKPKQLVLALESVPTEAGGIWKLD